jgi:peptide/nickel transport system ATP-binding protein
VSPRRGRTVTDRFADAPLDGPLLEVDGVKTYFKTPRGLVRAVDGVSLTLERGKTIGVVGESGSGKSVLSRSIMGLLPNNVVREGSIKFEGREIGNADTEEMRRYWGTQMSMVFQDPMTSLNPVMRVGNQITESLRYHLDVTKDYANETALALLQSVGIPEAERRLREYPHQLSGGMRQRVMIAIALACGPRLLFADEPTTALDVTVQAQILDLIRGLQKEFNSAVVIITHDLGVVAELADDILVMYAGRAAEYGTAEQIFNAPEHPYAWGLLGSMPRFDKPPTDRLLPIKGTPPSLIRVPAGCAFNPRCDFQPRVGSACLVDRPDLLDNAGDHLVACHIPPAERQEIWTQEISPRIS